MKKLLFFCLIFIFIFSFAGCVTLQFQQQEPAADLQSFAQTTEPTVQATTPVEQSTVPVTQAAAPSDQTAVSVEQTTQAVQQVQTTQAPIGNADAANWSLAEIVAFMNTSVGRAKSNIQPYVLKESSQHFISMHNINSASMQSMAQAVIEKLNRNTVNEYTVVSGVATGDGVQANISELLPPAGAVFALQESDITAARASYDGGDVLLVMTLRDDTATAAQPVPALHGAKLPYVSLRGQSIEPYTLQDAQIAYTDITYAARVDGQGRLLTLTVSATVNGVGIGGIGVMNAEVQFGGTIKHVWTFTYS